MGYKLFIWLLLSGLLVACSNDFILQTTEDPVPVVCFIMNPADSIFKITLTKTFSGDESGYDLARNPNKLYYQNANIWLEGWAGPYKVWESGFHLTDNPKESGIFTEQPGFCYQTKNEFCLEQSDNTFANSYDDITDFRLVLSLPGKAIPVISRISLVPFPIRIYPATPLKILDLCPDGSNYKAGIQFDKEKVKYCELICLFRYQEFQNSDQTWKNDSITFTVRKNIPIFDDKAITIIAPDFFFTRLADNIKPVNDTIVRKFKSLDLIFLVGDTNFQTYFSTYINSGNVDSPPAGNINGGIGLFAMVRSIRIEKKMSMNYRTLDYLSSSEYTRKLGFVRW
jgi:hypothetical protein